MKKIILLAIVLIGLNANAQQEVLFNEDCEALTVGDIGTDITGATPGQGGWTSTTNNGSNADFQIIAHTATNKAIKITGSNGATTNDKILDQFVGDLWTNRTPGNNVAQIEFDYFTGPTTTSKNFMRVALYDATKTKILAGLRIELNTLKIRGLAYYNNSGTLGNYSFTLGTTDVILLPNTWYRFGFSFNYGTGETLYKEVAQGLFNGGILGAAAAIDPSELYVFSTTQAGNTLAGTGIFDNIALKTDVTDASLLSNNKVYESSKNISISPNPSKNFVTINSADFEIKTVQIFDANGRLISGKNATEITNNTLDVSKLEEGIYLLKIESDKGITTQKLIKN